jgi:hypothetical protein
MPRHAVLPPITTGLSSHPAVEAWLKLGPRQPTPTAVTPLKPQLAAGHKSGIYRLHGVTAGRASLIAKRSRSAAAAVERIIYQGLLPRLPLPTLQLHGTVAEPGGDFDWLFLEDAGDESYRKEDYGRVVEWLGRLQTAATPLAGTVPLPEHGPGRYLAHLQAARREILANHGMAHLTERDREMLGQLVSMLETLDRRWADVERACRAMPVTLVHGDFVRKNLRTRPDDTCGEFQFFALDWETAGWGIPAADLAGLATYLAPQDPAEAGADDDVVDRYVATVAPCWRCTRRHVETWANLGALFRLLASIEWACYSLPYPPALKARAQMVKYERSFAGIVKRLGWRD